METRNPGPCGYAGIQVRLCPGPSLRDPTAIPGYQDKTFLQYFWSAFCLKLRDSCQKRSRWSGHLAAPPAARPFPFSFSFRMPPTKRRHHSQRFHHTVWEQHKKLKDVEYATLQVQALVSIAEHTLAGDILAAAFDPVVTAYLLVRDHAYEGATIPSTSQ
eukprot:2190766-Rhodomonas_salina.2